jgi:asparagine synthase (glutamine-hydrolysing)
MCGIAGIFNHASSAEEVRSDLLERMCSSIAHRGPDGQGIYLDRNLGLGHRRLAILDLSESGKQPMADPERRYVITYNGEIYNYRDLRKTLEEIGSRFIGTSDTEVILHAYRNWGIAALEKLNGIFALAIWDSRERSLLLARDPVGIKPLFYSNQSGKLIFGSEMKVLLSHPEVSREVDPEAIHSFFSYNYVPSPKTGISGIHQLEPGHFLLAQGGKPVLKKEFSAFREVPTTEIFPKSESELHDKVQEFRSRLHQTVNAQTIADVPVGGFLSGGLDSSAVADALSKNASKVQLFNVRFKNSSYDESATAKEIADILRAPLVQIDTDADIRDLPKTIAMHLEEPTADSSAIPMYLLCQAASRHVKVALSGDGADETLAGYETYRATMIASRLKSKAFSLPFQCGKLLARHLPVSDKKYGLKQVLSRFLDNAQKPFPLDHSSWRTILTQNQKRKIYSDQFLAQTAHWDPYASYGAPLQEIPYDADLLTKMLHMDFRFYLPNDMLVKVDRMSMAHGLEVRVPFLDIEFVRYCRSLPSELKLRSGKSRKFILRESLRQSLPDRILNLPKSGFNFPIELYLRDEWYSLFMDTIRANQHQVGQYLKISQVEALLKAHRDKRADNRHELFGILMFSLWLDHLRTFE